MKKHLVSLFFISTYTIASTDTICDKNPSADKVMVVRQSLDGDKNEKKPAQLLFSHNAGEQDIINADIGVRLKPIDLSCNNFLYPTLEYHSQSGDKKSQLLSVGFKYYKDIILEDSATLRYLGVDPDKRENLALFTDLSASGKRDLENDLTYMTISAGSSLYMPYRSWALGGTKWFNEDSNDGMDIQSLNYALYPYFALEYNNNMPKIINEKVSDTEKIDSTYLLARYYLEFWPQAHSKADSNPRLQFVVSYDYRQRIGGDGIKNPTWFDSGINYYFDENENFSIGASYSAGENPKSSFLKQEKATVALKFKF